MGELIPVMLSQRLFARRCNIGRHTGTQSAGRSAAVLVYGSRVQPRDTAARVADAQRRLGSEANIWIATSSSSGEPHLVALSLWWDGASVMATTPAANRVAINIAATGVARASLPDAEDVVTMKAAASIAPLADVDAGRRAEMVAALGWDPTDESGEWVLLTLTPELIWSWNGLHEDSGRTIMRSGSWLS